MELSFKIGTRTETVQVPDEAVLGVLEPNHVPVGLTDQAEVCRALAEPIGTPRLRQIVRPGEKVAIVTSDITRPMPTWVVLPPVLEELYSAGVRPEDTRWCSPWAATESIPRRRWPILPESRPGARSAAWISM